MLFSNRLFIRIHKVSFSVFLTFQRVDVTWLNAAIINPMGTLWLAPMEVSSPAQAIAPSATHILTGMPRRTRLVTLLKLSSKHF